MLDRLTVEMRKYLYGIAWALTAIVIGSASLALSVHAGLIDISADQPHSPAITGLLEWTRERAILRRSSGIEPPNDLADPERARRGAGNYAAMCANCHLAAGQETSELRSGLYPQPPNLAQPGDATKAVDSLYAAARQFWIIKHGIAASGMPAWSKTGMEDKAIWDLVAFLQILPTLSAEKYQQIVEASDGHSHTGADKSHPPAASTVPIPASPRKQPRGHSHDKHSH